MDLNDSTNRFFATLSRHEAEGLASPVGQALRAHNPAWAVEQTGGGCMTFSLSIPGGWAWITEEDGATLPLSLDTPVCVGLYAADDDCGPECVSRYLPSVAAALAFLADPQEWRAALCEEFRDWRKRQGIDIQAFRGDALEMLSEELTEAQRGFLVRFVERWDQMETVIKAGEA